MGGMVAIVQSFLYVFDVFAGLLEKSLPLNDRPSRRVF
jgi:hypothetical protein